MTRVMAATARDASRRHFPSLRASIASPARIRAVAPAGNLLPLSPLRPPFLPMRALAAVAVAAAIAVPAQHPEAGRIASLPQPYEDVIRADLAPVLAAVVVDMVEGEKHWLALAAADAAIAAMGHDGVVLGAIVEVRRAMERLRLTILAIDEGNGRVDGFAGGAAPAARILLDPAPRRLNAFVLGSQTAGAAAAAPRRALPHAADRTGFHVGVRRKGRARRKLERARPAARKAAQIKTARPQKARAATMNFGTLRRARTSASAKMPSRQNKVSQKSRAGWL